MRNFHQRLKFAVRIGFSPAQARGIARLRTPHDIQDFVTAVPINFEPDGDTCLPAAEALRQKRAHCIEGAFIAAAAFWCQGQAPLLLDFQARNDDDHVVALFRSNGCWGAVSKSNHVWLRYRDPVYRSLRELTMSYFHDYVGKGRRTLHAYSQAFDLRRFDSSVWVGGRDSCWEVANVLDESRHYRLLTPDQGKKLRNCDAIEIRANKLVDFEKPRNMRKNKAKP